MFNILMEIDDDILSEDFIGQADFLNAEINKLRVINEVLIADKNIVEQELECSKISNIEKEKQIELLKMENSNLQNIIDSQNNKCRDCDIKTDATVDLKKHGVSVHEGHIQYLQRFKTIVKSKPDGACLFNCASLHIYGDESKASYIRESVNNHIHKNWGFYREKIAFPYTETVLTKKG